MNIVDRLSKKFDSKDTIKFSDKNIYSKEDFWLFSGSPELEFNLGILGWPVGLIEFAGKSKSGKTTLALVGMKNFQKKHPDGVSIILSSENRDNKLYAEEIGVDTEKVLIIKSRYVEDLFHKLQRAITEVGVIWRQEGLEGKPKIYIVWDSLGATLSLAEKKAFDENVMISEKSDKKKLMKDDGESLKKEKEKNPAMAAFARNAKMAVKSVLAQIYDYDICFVMLNHRYPKMGFMAHGTQSGGGQWVELFCTLRFEMIRKNWVKVGGDEVGQITEMKVEKNDYGSRRSTDIEILLGKGVVLSEQDIEYALNKNILKIVKVKKTEKIDFMGKLQWANKKEFYDNYWDNNKFIPLLTSKILKCRHEDVLKEKGLL